MRIPALVIRESSERPEVYDTGNVLLTGLNRDIISNSIDIILNQREGNVDFLCPQDYLDINVSEKVVRLVVGLCKIIIKKEYYML